LFRLKENSIVKLKYPQNYNNINSLEVIFKNTHYNPNFLIDNIPVWIWVLHNSNNSNLIHYVLDDIRININNIDIDKLLQISSTKDKSVHERISKAFNK
jgi:hypothetical protein